MKNPKQTIMDKTTQREIKYKFIIGYAIRINLLGGYYAPTVIQCLVMQETNQLT